MLDTSLFVSESFYLSQYSDVATAVAIGVFSNARQHFESFGRFEGRDPSLLFSNAYYLQQNADVAAAVNAGIFRSGFEHFNFFGRLENRDTSRLFDTRLYLQQNSDVAAAVERDELTGIEHYLGFGQFEGRNPSELFNTRFYRDQNFDVAAAADRDTLTEFGHFLNFGASERRSPSLLFNSNFYLQQNQDVATAVINRAFTSAFEHYLDLGITERRFGSDIAINPSAIYISNNGSSNAGDVDRTNGIFAGSKRFVAGNNEGVDLDILGNLYQAGDATAGSIRVISQIRNRAEGEGFTTTRDRELRGAQTGLVNPKGFAIAQTAGFTIIADNGARNLKVFGTAAAGDVPPVATTALSANPWDVAYDENRDRLFVALVDGTVSVFDNYIGNGTNIGSAGVSRTITPVNAAGTKVSTNLHGIVYEPTGDRLVVTDVGAATAAQSANFNRDGRLYVLNNVSTANGNVIPSRAIEGPATLLGNPVDLILDGNNVRVAEKANDRLLIFSNIFSAADGNVTPDISVTELKPESLISERSLLPLNPDVTDVNTPAIPINSIVTTSNPPAAGTTDFVAKLSTNLQRNQGSFNTLTGVPSLENITFDLTGDALITFDSGSDTNGGILFVNRLAESRNGGAFSSSRDRIISGANTGLVSPKGLEVADNLGLVFVAENNAATPAILAFSTQAAGNVAPVLRTANLAGRRPWDVDYDSGSDRLFVAATDGTVLVYDRYAATQGANGPTRVITPFDPAGTIRASINLHGIIYVESSNTLLLSDVGSAASATDGQLFIMTNASTANGNVPVRAQIGGANTRLGNPVDITFDGIDLYVAEKSNDLIMRFDNILNLSGVLNVAPNLTAARNKPESVAIAPDYLSARPV